MQNSDNRLFKATGSLAPSTITPNPDTADGRAKRLVRFHLDIARDDDYELLEHIKAWKKQRQFLPTLRKALMLFISLLMGDLSVLAELFPSVVDTIKQQAIAEHEQQQANDQFEALINQAMQRIENKLDTVSVAAVAEPIVATIPDISQQSGLGGIQGIAGTGKTFTAAPLDYDDEDMVLEVTKASSNSNASQNFLDAMNMLQQGSR